MDSSPYGNDIDLEEAPQVDISKCLQDLHSPEVDNVLKKETSENAALSKFTDSKTSFSSPQIRKALRSRTSLFAHSQILHTERDWNEEFQRLLEKPTSTPEESQERIDTIKKLSKDFVENATPIVKTIISERESKTKTIKPIEIGGIAGGIKFVHSGIFFKYAENSKGAYPNDEFAQKSAAHEITSLINIISCFIDNLHAPLTAMINYHGFRMTAMSVLPLSSKTIVYGSRDACRTTFCSDSKMNDMMKQLGKILNIKGHYVGDEQVFLHTCGDIEGHLGLDGRYYVLDYARLFPPCPPTPNLKASFLFRLMRPEFVKKYPIPLSSDVYTNFQCDKDRKGNEQEATEAYQSLLNETIPLVAYVLEELWQKNPKDCPLTEIIHQHGVNVRFLGKVAEKVQETSLQARIYSEIVGRVIVQLCKAQIRQLEFSQNFSKHVEILDPYFHPLTVDPIDPKFEETLAPEIELRFGNVPKKILSRVFLRRIFLICTEKLGFYWNQEYFQHVDKLCTDFDSGKHVSFHLNSSKLIELRATVKETQVMPFIETLRKMGRFHDVESFYEELLVNRMKKLGPDHLAMAVSHQNLAEVFAQQGKKDKAETHFLKMIEIISKNIQLKQTDEISMATASLVVADFYMMFAEFAKSENFLQYAVDVYSKDPDHAFELSQSLAKFSSLKNAQGHYAEAEDLCKQSIQLSTQVLGVDHPDSIIGYSNLAKIYFEMGQFSESEKLLEKVVFMNEAIFGPEHSKTAQSYCDLGMIYYKQGKYDEAESKFQKTFKIREKALGSDNYLLAQTLDKLAAIATVRGNFEKAQKLYEQSLPILIKKFGNDNLRITETKNKLGFVLFRQGNYAIAEQIYLESLEIRKRHLGTEHVEIARSYHALAELYFKMGKLKEAKEYNSMALAMREKCVGGSPDVANSLTHLAKLNNSLGNYTQALEMQEKSLSLLQNTLGSNHLQVAQCYQNLGDLHYRQGRFQHSETCYQKSLEIRNLVLGDSLTSAHPDVASILGALAYLYATQGKYKVAKDYFQRALRMLETIFPPEHPDVAKMKNNIGFVLMKMGEFTEAEKSIFGSVEMLKKTLGINHPELANTLDDLAEVYLGQSKFQEAESHVKHALEIRKSVFGDSHAEIANSLVNLGNIEFSKSKYALAHKHYQEAMSIYEQTLGKFHRKIAKCLHFLGKCEYRFGHYDKSNQLFTDALTRLEEQEHENRPDIAQVYHSLAYLQASLGDFTKSAQFYQKSISVLESLVGTNHPEVAAIYNNYSWVLFQLGKYDTAEDFLQKSLSMRLEFLGKNHPEVARALHHLAELRLVVGKLDSAESLTVNALQLRKKIFGKIHADVANSWFSLALIYLQKAKYDLSLQSLSNARKIHEILYGTDHPRVIDTIHTQGQVFYKQGKYSDSETLFKYCLETRVKIYNNKHPSVASSLSSLGYLYLSVARYNEAEKMFEEAIEIYSSVFHTEKHPLIATLYADLAQLYAVKAQYPKSLELNWQCFRLRLDIFGQEHPEVARTKHELATILNTNGKFLEAEKLNQEAFEIRSKIYGKSHVEIARSMLQQGVIQFSQGKFSESEISVKSSLKMYRELLPAKHPKIALCLYQLAKNMSKLGKYQEAIELYQEALNIRKECYKDDNHPEIAENFAGIGYTLASTGKYEESKLWYQKALNMAHAIFGSKSLSATPDKILAFLDNPTLEDQVHESFHPLTSTIKCYLGWVLEKQAQYLQATKFYSESLMELLATFGRNQPEVARGCFDLAGLFLAQKDLVNALRFATHALQIRENLLPKEHVDIGYCHVMLGKIAGKKGEKQKALNDLEIAEKIFGSSLGHYHLKTASLYLDLAKHLKRMKETDEAKHKVLQCIHIYSKIENGNHPNLAHCYYFLGKITEDSLQKVKFLQQSLEIFSGTLGPQHPKVVKNEKLLEEATKQSSKSWAQMLMSLVEDW